MGFAHVRFILFKGICDRMVAGQENIQGPDTSKSPAPRAGNRCDSPEPSIRCISRQIIAQNIARELVFKARGHRGVK